jgi:hypothetical protein
VRSFFRPAGATTGTGARPQSLVAAVALVGLQALVLIGTGAAFVVAGLLGRPTNVLDAELIGALSMLGGAGLALVARGLAGRRAWARSPALVWQMIMVGSGATRLTEAPALAVPMVVIGVLTIVALFHPDTGAVLED